MDGLHIGRHIISLHAIAAGHRSYEVAPLIGERYGGAIILDLAAELEGLSTEGTLHTGIEVPHLVKRVGIAQREHGVSVRHLHKLIGDVATYTLGRRRGVKELGVLGFEILQLTHQAVKVEVRYLGPVEHVVVVVMSVQLFTQLRYTFVRGHRWREG